ncbi:MAG: hypothetical protein ACXVII_43330 [Solirubrobacteraceae bacterium]
MLRRFVLDMRPGDDIGADGGREILGPYRFRRELVEAPHTRDVARRKTLGRQQID